MGLRHFVELNAASLACGHPKLESVELTRYHMGMKPKIYVETSVISYLTARASRDFATVARQEFSRQWWDRRGETYQVSISTLVLQEISKGESGVLIVV